MKISIGDKVNVNRNGRFVPGTVSDVLASTAGNTFFSINLLNGENCIAEENQVFLEQNEDEYSFFIDIVPEKNVVIAKMNVNGKEIARGHGHVIHSGELGIAQATSYAFKRIYDRILEEEGDI